MNINTRFAPSSTGVLHVGSMRTALYSWLFAKRYNGSFILRIEDTDFNRSDDIFLKNILKTFSWLGILWDKGPYVQSQRLLIYKKKIHEMLSLGHAYKCYCSSDRLNKVRLKQISQGEKPRYDRLCRNIKSDSGKDYVVRFKNPLSGQVIFRDQIRGKIIFNNIELDDLIIQRRNGIPTYNFCVVVDDFLMNITHVIRGEDHINNTPRQINILKSLNAPIPIYAHVSMVVNNKKNNLSKRKQSMSILQYKKQGFLKEAILNYLFKLGWSNGDREIFSLSDMKKLFSLKRLSLSSSEFNFKKLLWFNHYYLNKLPIDKNFVNLFKKHLVYENISYHNNLDLIKIINVLRSRCYTIKDIVHKSKIFFNRVKNFDIILIRKYFFLNKYYLLHYIYKELFFFKNWCAQSILNFLKVFSIKHNILLKNIFMSLRLAITGLDSSPSINIIMDIIGKSESLIRIKKYYIFLIRNYIG